MGNETCVMGACLTAEIKTRIYRETCNQHGGGSFLRWWNGVNCVWIAGANRANGTNAVNQWPLTRMLCALHMKKPELLPVKLTLSARAPTRNHPL